MHDVPKFLGFVRYSELELFNRVSLKIIIIVFSKETPCWSPSEGLQHGSRKPVETSGVYLALSKRFLPLLNLKIFA